MRPRLIPLVTIENGNAVKTISFSKRQYIGDPINAIDLFSEKCADEIIVLDITNSKIQSEPNFQLLKSMADSAFVPLAYGGKVYDLDTAKKIFNLGIEKVVIRSALISKPKLVNEISNYFGSQALSGVIDIFENDGKYFAIFPQTKPIPIIDFLPIIKNYIDDGLGEIVFQSINRDGTLSGLDLKLIPMLRDLVRIPIVLLGGCSSILDAKKAFDAGASAVAAGSLFVFSPGTKSVLINYPSELIFDEILNHDTPL